MVRMHFLAEVYILIKARPIFDRSSDTDKLNLIDDMHLYNV